MKEEAKDEDGNPMPGAGAGRGCCTTIVHARSKRSIAKECPYGHLQ
jgi:hypothetical protein